MARAVLAPEAAADLDEIWLYIAEESGSADVADGFIDRVTALFLRIVAEPYMGRQRDDLHRDAQLSDRQLPRVLPRRG